MSERAGAAGGPARIHDSRAGEIRRFGRVEVAVTRALDGRLHGDYRGLLPGPGSETGDARAYVAGDDVRRIDWAVTARTQQTHVRDTTADHELLGVGLVDLSAQMHYGTADAQKRDVALDVAAAMGFVINKGANRYGMYAAHPDTPLWVPPAAGRAHVHQGMQRLAGLPRPGGGDANRTALADGLVRLGRLVRRRGVLVVVSDFAGTRTGAGDETWARPLRALCARHNVVCIEVADRREQQLADVGLVALADPASGRIRQVDTSRPEVRARFAQRAADRRAEVAGRIRRTGADHLRVQTEGDWMTELATHIARRQARIQRGVGS